MTRREIAGGLIVLAALALGSRIPAYRERLAPAWRQATTLPARLRAGNDALDRELKGGPYVVAASIRDLTPEDAVILIPHDTAREGELASPLWLSYYLYPRVLVDSGDLEIDPAIRPDYCLATPRFHPGVPDSLRPDRPALLPLSERARRRASATGTEP